MRELLKQKASAVVTQCEKVTLGRENHEGEVLSDVLDIPEKQQKERFEKIKFKKKRGENGK